MKIKLSRNTLKQIYAIRESCLLSKIEEKEKRESYFVKHSEVLPNIDDLDGKNIVFDLDDSTLTNFKTNNTEATVSLPTSKEAKQLLDASSSKIYDTYAGIYVVHPKNKFNLDTGTENVDYNNIKMMAKNGINCVSPAVCVECATSFIFERDFMRHLTNCKDITITFISKDLEVEEISTKVITENKFISCGLNTNINVYLYFVIKYFYAYCTESLALKDVTTCENVF